MPERAKPFIEPKKLSAPSNQLAWNALAADEANTVLLALERPDLKVMVVIVAAHSDPDGTTDLIFSVSGRTKKSHAKQFKRALEKRVEFLAAKIAETGASK